jgi:hypothetical protein
MATANAAAEATPGRARRERRVVAMAGAAVVGVRGIFRVIFDSISLR